MNCVDLVCGTGGWSGPKPGDPDSSNVSLTATPGFGGVNVAWTYPNVNPYAVAYTVVYRGSSSSFNTAVEIAKVAGNRYLDPMELHDSGLYYYWIRIVSIHGTEGHLIGPAECRMRSTIGQLIDDLSGEIAESALEQHLREKLGRVQQVGDGLLAESKAREGDILAVSRTIEGLQVAVDSSVAMISVETLARISTIDALARQLITISAEFNGKFASVQQEIGTLASDAETVARRVTSTEVVAHEATAAIRSEEQSRISAVNGLSNQISAVSQKTDHIESSYKSDLASARQQLQTQITSVNGKVTGIQSRYSVIVDVNGFSGGFGLMNDGKTVEANFLVNKFSIGSTTANKRKPFIVRNGVVYMDEVMIQNATIDVAKIKQFDANVANIANATIGNATIDFAKIKNVKIDNGHIGNLKVSTLMIGDSAVTSDKLAAYAAGHSMSGTRPFLVRSGPKGAHITIIVFFTSKGGGARSAHLRFGDHSAYAEEIAYYVSPNEGMGWIETRLVPGVLQHEVSFEGSHTVNVPTGCRAIAISTYK